MNVVSTGCCVLCNDGIYPGRAGSVDGGVIERAGVVTSTDLTRPGELTLHLDGTPDAFAAPYWILALGNMNGVSLVSHLPSLYKHFISFPLGCTVQKFKVYTSLKFGVDPFNLQLRWPRRHVAAYPCAWLLSSFSTLPVIG